jgi:hypothetical protein
MFLKINNISDFNESKLYYCHDYKIHDFLYNTKKIVYVNKSIDADGNKLWIYFKSILLNEALLELGV